MNRIKEMNKRLDEREQEVERLNNIIKKLNSMIEWKSWRKEKNHA